MKRLGLFGGSFDPVHYGHLILADRAAEELRLDRVLFVPASAPPHKLDRRRASGRDRLSMLRLALTGHPRFEASDLELRRGGISYTVETLRELRRRRPRVRLFLLLGSDSLVLLPGWKDVAEITRRATFVVARRPDSEPSDLPIMNAVMRRIDAPLVGISSTQIRERVRRGRSIRYLTPPAVTAYIARRRLYRP